MSINLLDKKEGILEFIHLFFDLDYDELNKTMLTYSTQENKIITTFRWPRNEIIKIEIILTGPYLITPAEEKTVIILSTKYRSLIHSEKRENTYIYYFNIEKGYQLFLNEDFKKYSLKTKNLVLLSFCLMIE